jgi:hypothetical protein
VIALIELERPAGSAEALEVDLSRVRDLPGLLKAIAQEMAERESHARIAALATQAASERYPSHGGQSMLLVAAGPLQALVDATLRTPTVLPSGRRGKVPF